MERVKPPRNVPPHLYAFNTADRDTELEPCLDQFHQQARQHTQYATYSQQIWTVRETAVTSAQEARCYATPRGT